MASNDTLGRYLPLGSEAPSANYATFDMRNLHPVLDFDATTDESVFWTDVMPANYAGGGITCTIIWAASTATSGTCRWSIGLERLADADTQADDLDTDSFATDKTAGATCPGTSSGRLQYTTISFTNGAEMDSIVANEAFRIRVTRDADGTSGTDDMTGDAELVALLVKET